MKVTIDLSEEEQAFLISAIHVEEVLSGERAMAEHLRRKLKLEELQS